MASAGPKGGDRCRRRWTFASCVFDEANWALFVRNRRVAVEAKPLELLRELLLRRGNVVTKDELLQAIWPNVIVVEASLPTAMRKLRRALGKDRLVETVSGIGYRLTVPVHVEEVPFTQEPADSHTPRASAAVQVETISRPASPRLMSIAAAIAIVLAGLAIALGPSQDAAAIKPPIYTQKDATHALRMLDIGAIDKMLAAGWDPNATFDKDGTDSMAYLLNMCEWDPAHDQRKMMLMGRALLDGGADIQHRNVWGDTAYSIAKAKRYCGPEHPVTKLLKAICYNGLGAPGDRCLAAYELTAAQRKAQGLPPKEDNRAN